MLLLEQKVGARIKQDVGNKCGIAGVYIKGKEGGRRLIQERVYMECLQPVGGEFVQKMLEKVVLGPGREEM